MSKQELNSLYWTLCCIIARSKKSDVAFKDANFLIEKKNFELVQNYIISRYTNETDVLKAFNHLPKDVQKNLTDLTLNFISPPAVASPF